MAHGRIYWLSLWLVDQLSNVYDAVYSGTGSRQVLGVYDVTDVD